MMDRDQKIEVRVRMTMGGYIARANGKTASSTAGAESAVKALAVKLWGEGEHSQTCLGDIEYGVQRWQITRRAA